MAKVFKLLTLLLCLLLPGARPHKLYLYDCLRIQIAGEPLSKETISRFEQDLHDSRICESCTIEEVVLPQPEKIVWPADLVVFENSNRKRCDIFISIWKCHYMDATYLGARYSKKAIALFYNGAMANSVLLHEMGHVFFGDYHCSNKDCVMYPYVTSNYKIFDETCRKKLSEQTNY